MIQVLTGHSKVDAISQIRFEGNVTPNSWYSHITYSTKRGTYAHFLAVAVLSDVVYWYRASEIRDETTGATIEWRKKFNKEKLQRGYKQIAEQFNATVEQAKDACKLLCGLGLISLSFETVHRPNETSLGNVMFIDIHPEAISAISYRPKSVAPLSVKSPSTSNHPEGQVKSPGGSSEITHSYGSNQPDITEITSKISTKTSLESSLEKEDDRSSFSDEPLDGKGIAETYTLEAELIPEESEPEEAIAPSPVEQQSPEQTSFVEAKVVQEDDRSAAPKRKRKNAARDYSEAFEDWWGGYYRFTGLIGVEAGNKGEAFDDWFDLFGRGQPTPEFLEGDAYYQERKQFQFAKESKAIGVPHACRYLSNSKWKEALDHKRLKETTQTLTPGDVKFLETRQSVADAIAHL